MPNNPELDCEAAWEMAYLDCEHYVNGLIVKVDLRVVCMTIDECARRLVPPECCAADLASFASGV